MQKKNELIYVYPFHIFEEDSNYYLFTSTENKIFRIDEKVKYLLEHYSPEYDELKKKCLKYMSIESFENTIKELMDIRVLYNKNIKLDSEKTITEIRSMILMIIQDCNLACSYCYGGEGEYHDKGIMSIEIAKKSVDYLVDHCGKNKTVTLVFFGGEPLLNIKLIKELLPYIKKTEKERKIKIIKNMTTNGTLITKEVEKFLLENEIGIKISIDGCKKINDRNRYFKNGMGVHDIVIENTRNLRKMGIVSARGTITPISLNTEETFRYLKSLNFKNVGLAYADASLTDEDYFRIFKIQVDNFKHFEEDLNNNVDIKNKYDIVKSYLSTIHSSMITRYPCGTGRKTIAVDRKGNIYPCHRFVGEERYIIGNIISDRLVNDNFLSEVNLDNHKECNECWVRNLCLGKCPFVNFSLTGDIKKAYPLSCTMTRAIYDEAVKLYVRLKASLKKW